MDFHRANEAAIAKRDSVIEYADHEGLSREGVAHAGYRMGYLAGADLIESQFGYAVIAEHGKDLPEAIVGSYSSQFEADAVALAWNKINNKYGIAYRVEVGG